MNKFERNYSKKTITLLFVLALAVGTTNGLCPDGSAITPEIQSCIDSIRVDGQFCRTAIVGPGLVAELYADKTAYCCHVNGVYDSNPFFQKEPVNPTLCNPGVASCNTTTTYSAYTFHSENGDVTCKVLFSEVCYRNFNSNNDIIFAQDYEPSGAAILPEHRECCQEECHNRFSINIGGCGSDGLFYADLNNFCDEYCYNRTLTILGCHSTSNGYTCNDPSCPSICEIEALEVPSCGSDGNLYATKALLCAAFDNGTIASYDQCTATNGCQQSQCTYNKCMQDLAELNYQGPQICGSSGTFYNTLDGYCTAIAAETEYFFSLCANGPCANEDECCLRVCNNGNDTFSTYCDNSFNFYNDKALYCDAFCAASISEVLCGGDHCTESGCCVAECVDTYPNNVCNRLTGQLWSNESMCESVGCPVSLPTLAIQCFDQLGSVIPCTQEDCDFFHCEETMLNNGGERAICGANATFYADIESYCNAVHRTNSVEYEVMCNGSSCLDSGACCNAHCNQITFAGGYQERCDVSYNEFLTRDAYCSEFCTNGGFNDLMCLGELCTLVECCQQNCVNLNGSAVCSATFQLITGTSNCENNCTANGGVIYECTGDCTSNDCSIFECVHSTLADYQANVCVKQSDGSFTFMSKEDSCPGILFAGGTPFMCENCTNTVDCSNAYCASQITIGDAICDQSFNIYTTAFDFCQANSNDLNNILDCNGSMCDHRECCFAKCETEITTAACNIDHHYVMTAAERCHYRCGNQHIGRNDLVVNKCYDGNGDETDCLSCEIFRCEADFSGYSYDTVCTNDGSSESYYGSVNAYCMFLIGLGTVDFNWNLSIPCDGAECANADDCCVAACEINQAAGFFHYCNLDGYSVVDLNMHCQSECGVVADITNTFSCGNENCLQFDCNVEKCKAEANNQFASICFTSEFHSNFFYASLNGYCEVAVENGETVFDVTGSEMSCNGNACTDLDDCCYHRCLTETYVDSCSADSHGVINQAAYCNHRCYNNVDRINMVLDTCHDANGQVACTDCAVFDCEDSIIALAYSFTTVCLNNNDVSIFFASYLDLCGYLVANTLTYEITNDNTCGGNGCADEDNCCYHVCMSTSYQPGCDDSFVFYDQNDYCLAFCDNNTPTLTYCGNDVCTAELCMYRECMDIIRPVYTEMCLKDSVNTLHFFDGKEAYCNAKVLAQETDYTNFDEIFCVLEGRCEDVGECCHYRCTNEEYLAGCHNQLHHLVTEQEFCAFRCDAVSNPNGDDLSLITCSDGNGDRIACSADFCSQQDCVSWLGDTNNYNAATVCSTTDDFYFNYQSFCSDVNGDLSMLRMCTDTNANPIGCGSDDQCCLANCLEMSGYAPRCNTTDYIFRDTLLSYCENYCANGRVFDAYLDSDGNFASQEMCCSVRCTGNSSSHQMVCNAGNFMLVDEVGTCQHLCEYPSGMGIISCGSADCTQRDCNEFKCLKQLENIMYNSTHVCGSNNVFYSREGYCDAREDDNTIGLVLCGNSACGNEDLCCQSNCINNYIGAFQEMCDMNYNVFTNIEDYCLAKCTAPPTNPLSALQCGGNNCNLNECCKQECMSEVYTPMCSPQPECELMDQQTYCNNRCDQVNFAPMTCDQPGGCTQANCDYYECLFAVDLVHESNPVCGGNGLFYNDEAEYCTNKALGTVDHFFLCDGGVCGDTYDCCYNVCLDDNSGSYNPRCGEDFTLHSTVQEYCNAKCTTLDYSDLMCGDMYCTAEQCCSLECQAQPYPGHCDDDFNYLSHAAYCDNDCAANGHGIITCANGPCTPQICEQLKCENDLSSRQFDSICVDPAYDGSFFYLTRVAYCETLISNGDAFLVLNEVNCVDALGVEIACAGEHECCVARCLEDNRHDVCSSTYNIITPEVFCLNQCNLTPITNFRTCSDAQSQQEDCQTCENFRCADLTAGFTSTICAPALTPHFSASASAFCDEVVGQGLDIQLIINSITLCDGNNCDFNTCCIADCEENNAATYVDICDVESFVVYDLRAHCTDFCASTTTSTEGCGAGNNCVLNDCRVKDCLLNAGASTDPELCLNPAQSGRNFYSQLSDFCIHIVANGMTTYDASTSIQCSGNVNCQDTYNCCIARCVEETYIEGCDLTNYNLVNELQYCTHRCDNNAHEIVNYVNMNLHQCFAGAVHVPCNQNMCNAEHCSTVFAGYAHTSICLTNNSQTNFYFASVDAYCTHMLSLPVPDYNLPDFYTCNNGQNCDTLDDCCFARCMNETYFVGCHMSSHTLVSQNLFCTHRCAAGNPTRNDLQMNECGVNTNCTTCEFFKCLDVVSGASDNICLYVFSNIAYFYNNHDDYCNAKVGQNQIDYALTAGNSLDCGDSVNGCADSTACCMAKCMNQTFFNVCRSTDFLLFNNQNTYCVDQCSGNPSSFDVCLDNQNNQIDCNDVSCCEFEIDANNIFSRVCDNNGVLYNNSFEFCTEREDNNAAITEVTCNGGECSQQACHTEYCVVASVFTNQVFPRCDSLYVHHASIHSFCDAKYTNNALTTISGCEGPGCNAIDCCLLQCSNNPNTPTDNVVVLINDQPIVYDNVCVAACNTNVPVFFTCTGITDHAVCLAEYLSSCDQHCTMYQSHTETYCGNTNRFLTAYQFCQEFECVAHTNPPDWIVTSGCEANDCTSNECSLNQCIMACGSIIAPVCGSNGVLYNNVCLLSCYNDVDPLVISFAFTCDSLDPGVDCQTECTFQNCLSGCNPSSLPVCAGNQIYPTSCHATCSGLSVNFTCQESCSGNLRSNRCAFDCSNGENPEL